MKSKLIFSVLTAALLSACGGSSSNDNPTTDNNSTTNNSTANNSQTQNQQSNTDNGLSINRNDTSFSGVFVSHANGGPGIVGPIDDSSNQTITFDGTLLKGDQIKLPTYAADKKEGGILIYGSANGSGNTVERDGLSYKTFQVSDNSYRYSQFGNIVTGSEFGGFYRGQRTVDMPTSGSASYQGDGILNFMNNNNLFKVEQGTVAANADFAAKTISFGIKSPSHSGHVDGQIIGSEFLGTSATSDLTNHAHVLGSFAGPKAEEMYGMYTAVPTAAEGSVAITGFFGAKQQ